VAQQPGDNQLRRGARQLIGIVAYKVAENFNLLAALAPGRIDLGVGKAPGGLPLSTPPGALPTPRSMRPGARAASRLKFSATL
jgi:hypothetical protein